MPPSWRCLNVINGRYSVIIRVSGEITKGYCHDCYKIKKIPKPTLGGVMNILWDHIIDTRFIGFNGEGG